jgi:hypothetical protein
MADIPFFANTPDDTHCVQAAFRIMLKHFLPELDFSYQELDRLSQKQPGKGTWWPPMLLELARLGLQVECIEGFDYKRFYEQGKDYVKAIYPSETADYYLDHSNLLDIKPMIPDLLNKVSIQTRPAGPADLDRLLDDGWLVGIDLNSRALNDRPGFVSHMVVIFGMDKNNYLLHDPGLPPAPNRQVDRRKLAEAWFWSGTRNAGLVAVKSAVKN